MTHGTVCMDSMTTRTDQVPDETTVDIGAHYFPDTFITPTPLPTTKKTAKTISQPLGDEPRRAAGGGAVCADAGAGAQRRGAGAAGGGCRVPKPEHRPGTTVEPAFSCCSKCLQKNVL